jgi:hypothetical protein
VREIDRGTDVGHAAHLGDQCRAAVECGVQDPAGLLVTVVVGQQQAAAQLARQLGQRRVRQNDFLPVARDGEQVAADSCGGESTRMTVPASAVRPVRTKARLFMFTRSTAGGRRLSHEGRRLTWLATRRTRPRTIPPESIERPDVPCACVLRRGVSSFIVTPQEPSRMSDLDRLVREVHHARERYLAAVRPLSPTQAHFKPAPEVWSVVENTEHITRAEQGGIYAMWRAIEGIETGDLVWEGEPVHRGKTIEQVVAETWKEKEDVPPIAAPTWGGSLCVLDRGPRGERARTEYPGRCARPASVGGGSLSAPDLRAARYAAAPGVPAIPSRSASSTSREGDEASTVSRSSGGIAGARGVTRA